VSFKTKLFKDSDDQYVLNGTMGFVMESYKSWDRYEATSSWKYTTPGIRAAMQAAKNSDGTSYEGLVQELQHEGTQAQAGENFKKVLYSYLMSLQVKGESYIDRMGFAEKEARALAGAITDKVLVAGFVPMGYYISRSDKEVVPGVLAFPSFYLLGVLPDDPTGATNFVARVSSHLRPKALADKGDVDFDMGKKYERKRDLTQQNPLAHFVWFDLQSFGAVILAKRVEYFHRALGRAPSKADLRDIRREYGRHLSHVVEELTEADKRFSAGCTVLANFLELAGRYYSALKFKANPDAMPRVPIGPFTTYASPMLPSVFVLVPKKKSGATVPSDHYAHIDRTVQYFLNKDDPDSMQAAKDYSYMFDLRCKAYTSYADRMLDILESYKVSLASFAGPLSSLVATGGIGPDPMDGVISAVADAFPFLEAQVSAMAALIRKTRSAFDSIFFGGATDLVRSEGYIMHDQWWDKNVNRLLPGQQGAKLSDSPKEYVRRLAGEASEVYLSTPKKDS